MNSQRKNSKKNYIEQRNNFNLKKLWKGFPREFEIFVEYIRDLGSSTSPDMNYLKKLLLKCLEKNRYSLDYRNFDWLKDEKIKRVNALKNRMKQEKGKIKKRRQARIKKRQAKYFRKENIKYRLRGWIKEENLEVLKVFK